MKQKIFMALMIIAALLLLIPMGLSAKGKPESSVLLKDANGEAIGRVIGMETVSWPYVMTDQGYRTLFRVGTGMIYNYTDVYYESANCTGDAYVSKRYPGTVFLPTIQDSLAYSMGTILYSPNDAKGAIVYINSVLGDDLNCLPYVIEHEFYPAYPNDPNITGIKNDIYTTRMLIE